MVDVFLEQFLNPGDIVAGDAWYIEKNGNKLSEGMSDIIMPILGCSVTNDSNEKIKVFINETENNSFDVPPNGSIPFDGIPIWDMAVRNMGTGTISKDKVSVVMFNDMEQVGRYKAYAKGRGF